MAGHPKGEELALPLETQRERTIELLSRHFAHDNLSLDELERRIERAYQARAAAELRDLVRDLPDDAQSAAPRRSAPVPDVFAPENDRIISIMTETRRRGAWRPARRLDLWSVMSDTRLDLTEALLAPGVTEIHVTAVMAALKLIVPPGVRVVLQADAFMSSVSDESIEPPVVGSGAPVIRVTGFVMMSDVKVRVRLRERLHEPLHPEPLI
jgi:hypothetical protein